MYQWTFAATPGSRRILFGSFSLNIGLRCSSVSGHLPNLGFLFRADPVVLG